MCRENKKNTGQNSIRGFSLIEIMVAILIIGTTFIGLLQAFPYAMKINKTAENQTIASYLAQAKLEELNQLDYEDVATTTIEVKHPLGATNTPLYTFQRETVATYVDGNMQDSAIDLDLKKITTTVYYTGSLSKTERSYIMQTLIADY